MTFKYLHAVGVSTFWLDHKLTPEVRAMLAAMASRAPLGGVQARYAQIVEAVAESLFEKWDGMLDTHPHTWAAAKDAVLDSTLPVLPGITVADYHRMVAEDRLCEYPLHPKVQKFFDDFVGKYGHCYDDQTEVLVRHEGAIRWMLWSEAIGLNGAIEVGAFDPTSDTVKFEYPSSWVAKPYCGRMYKVASKRGSLDLCVTPEHTMLVRKRECVPGGKGKEVIWSDWQGIPAETIYSKTTFRYKRGASRCAEVKEITMAEDPWGLAAVSTHAFGRLCGFFVGDGYAGGRQAGYLSFNIRKKREHAFFDALASDLGLKVIRAKSGCRHVHLKGARDWARNFFYHPTSLTPTGKPAKNIPAWVFTAPEDFVRGFLEGLRYSDGSRTTDDSWTYASSSKPVCEGLQILGTLWGCPVSIRGPVADTGAFNMIVTGWRNKEPVVNRRYQEDRWVDYDGWVYCATVSTGFLVVRRNHATMISGNSSILELVGQPTVYVEGVSWLTAWLTFDSPLCAGQEFSTRAVQHKDWPMARECEEVDVGATSILQAEDERILRQVAGQDIDLSDYKAPPILTPNRDLVRLHNDWFEVFEAEVAWWKAEFTSACPTCKGKGEYVRPGESYATHGITAGMPMTCEQCEGTGKKYPTADKEPFRPALDRARWALPGTIATGCAHTSNLRERARVTRDGSNLASLSGAVATKAVWDEIAAAYRLALPGMAGMGLREAVYTPGTNIPGHLRSILSSTDEGPDVELSVRYTGGIVGLQGYARTSEKSYMDAVENSRARVNVGFRCSLAVARDWHRHRTMFPWYLQVVRDNHGTPEPGPIQIDHHYGPMSDLAKAKTPGLLARSTNVFDYHMSSQNRMQAALALPLGTRVRLRGQGGLRDAVYMLSLRHTAVGANFEYKEQAGKALDILDAELKKGAVPV